MSTIETLTSTHSLLKSEQSMCLLKNHNTFLDNTGYPSAWKKFRDVYSEDVSLLKLVKANIGSAAPLLQAFSVYDIGCGDAALSLKILRGDIFLFENRPQIWHLIEPMQGFLPDIQVNQRMMQSQVLTGGKVDYKDTTISQLLDGNTFENVPGLILSIHSSYYFTEGDLGKLQNIKNKGYRLLIIENHPNCWVPKIMKAIGNTNHPQFKENRFSSMLRDLNHQTVSSSETFPLDNRHIPNLQEIEQMLDFFYCCADLDIDRAEKIARLTAAFNLVMNDSPAFVYSYAYIYNRTGFN
jgi:hypothetical protein